MRGYPISYSGRTESNGFDVLVQSHTKEVLDLPRRRKTRPFVEPDGPRERRGCIEADPLAVTLSEMCLCVCQQSRGNTAALRSGTYCHSSNMAFSRMDDTARNRAYDLFGLLRCYEYSHLLKASLDCFSGKYGVGERSLSVAVAIHLKGCGETREDAARICTRRIPNRVQKASTENLLCGESVRRNCDHSSATLVP
jgi:hypothetical protein